MGPKVDRHMCVEMFAYHLLQRSTFCILICLKPFRMVLNNSYVKIISIVYRGLAKRKSTKTIDIVQWHSEAEKNYSLALEWRLTISPGFGMMLNNYSAPFRMVSDKLECKKGALKQVSLQTCVCQHFEPSVHL